MAQPSGHVRKRQYQPSIHSYLHRDADAKSVPGKQAVPSLRSPPLPTETQASLLSVGMRVRKSVPEGYKTHKTIGVHISPIASTATTPHAARAKRRYPDSRARELTPFCGLHKTGGLAAQDTFSSSAPAVMQTDEEDEEEEDEDDDLPGLVMSQSTLSGTQDSFASSSSALSSLSRKRAYEDEMENELDIYFNDDQLMDSAAVPSGPHTDRAMPRPKLPLPHRSKPGGMVHVVGADDFDEAAFLTPQRMDVDGW